MEFETDAIGHLIEIEHQAATMLLDAQVEADRRINEAKLKAESVYKSEYEKIITDVELDYSNSVKEIDALHNDNIEQYRKTVVDIKLDTTSFNLLLDNLFFGK